MKTATHPMQKTFDELRRSRRNDADTALAAAQHSHGVAGAHEAAILRVLHDHDALTAHEIAACCDLQPVQVSRRLGHMRDDGVIVVRDQSGVTPSGRPAQRWGLPS